MRRRTLALALLCVVAATGCTAERPVEESSTPIYFGQSPPGATPQIFAPGIISLDDRYEYSIAFSPDLNECVFGVTDSLWATFTLLMTTNSADGTWSDPVPAPFIAGGDGLSPAYSADGNTVYFASSRPSYPPANLWQSTRGADGTWSEPAMIPAPVSSEFDEFAPCVDDAGALYFVSGRGGQARQADIYRATPAGGVYEAAEPLGATINTEHLDSTPFIARDGSYLLFESSRPGGQGQQDIWISMRTGDSWDPAVNLGPIVNTEQIEDEPYVSPDGKYLFFNRRAGWVTADQTEIWWVELQSVLDAVRRE